MVRAWRFCRNGWWVIAAMMLFAPGCDSPTGSGVSRSDIGGVFPADGADNQDLNVTLQWTEVDDSLKAACHYRVFLGTEVPPPPVINALAENSYMPGNLQSGTAYYWRVQAYRDTVPVASTPLMRFKTGHRFTYPLAVGLRWIYWHEIHSYADSPQSDPMYRDTGRAAVGIVATTTLFDSLDVYDFHIIEQVGVEYHTCHFYLNNTEDGLYTYGYTDPSSIAPRREVDPDGTAFVFGGRSFASPAHLFAFLRGESTDPAAKRPGPTADGYLPTESYAYPLRPGHQWTYRYYTDDGYPFRIDKKVIGRQRVTVPAGTFDCFVIQWFWDFDEDGQWEAGIDGYDYVATQGLVKREFFVGKVGVVTYEHPDGTGTYDFYDGYTLTDYGRDWKRGEW